MFNTLFKSVYFIEFLLITVVRKYFTGKLQGKELVRDKRSGMEIFLLVLNGIGMAVPLVYVFTSKLDFADYNLPDWVGWAGAVIFLDATWLLYLSHRDLGRHWTAIAGILKNHKLVTTGIYSQIRHPMYAAHFLWAIGQIMILHNWIAGYSFIITMLPFYFYRARKEEQMLNEEFGKEYRIYKEKTGALFPRL